MAKKLIKFSNTKGVHINLSRVNVPIESSDQESSHHSQSDVKEVSDFSINELAAMGRDIAVNFDGYEVGDILPEGIIFYVTESEYYVTSLSSIGNKRFGCYGDVYNSNTENGIGGGFANTEYMLDNCSDTDTAAILCNEYKADNEEEQEKGTWWLPSVSELAEIYSAGLLSHNETYLSSTEIDDKTCKGFSGSGDEINLSKNSTLPNIFPIKTIPKEDTIAWIPILYHLSNVNGASLAAKHLYANMSAVNKVLRKENLWRDESEASYASTSLQNQTGYLTGYQIPNPDGSGLIDEVRRWPVDNKVCRIQFFLPGRYKFEWLDPIISMEEFAFTLQEYKDHPDAPSSIKNLPTPGEWLSFGTNPGIIVWKEEWFTESNLIKLNTLARSIKGHDIQLTTNSLFSPSPSTANLNPSVVQSYPSHHLLSSIGWNSSSSGSSFISPYRVFGLSSEYYTNGKLNAGTHILHDDLDDIRFMHETLHGLGSLGHTFLPPRIQTTHSVGNYPHDNSPLYNDRDVENLDLYDNKLLPPFEFEYRNHMYDFAVDFRDQAEEERDDYLATLGDNYTSDEQDILDALNERALGAQAELDSTPEIITGDFELPGGNIHTDPYDEIKYIENIFKIPGEYTTNFTRKYSLVDGSETNKAEVTLNKAIEPYDVIFGSMDTNPMQDSYYVFQSLYRGVESFWGGSYIEDDDENKFFVVNPTNAVGPNVTSYIPFCVDPDNANGLPDKNDLTKNTKYDPFWMHNHNRFNPAFPAYPDNLETHKLYDQAYCPCLYTQQSYTSEGQVYTYTVMGESQNLTNLLNLYRFKVSNTFIFDASQDFYKLSPSENELTSTGHQGFFHISGNDLTGGSVLSNWLKSISNNFDNGYDNGVIPIQKNKNSTYLSIPYGIAYFGFGQHTTLPIYFKFNNEEFYQIQVPGDQDISYGDLLNELGVSSLPREEVFSQHLLLRQSDNFDKGGATGTSNLDYRYGWGTTNSNDKNYNPFKGTNFIHSVYGLCVAQTSFSTLNYAYTRDYEPDPDQESVSFEPRFWPTNTQIEALNTYVKNNPIARRQIECAEEIGFSGTWVTNPNLNPRGSIDQLNRPINEVNNYLNSFFTSLNNYTPTSVLGCTDSEALNYDPLATYDLQYPYFTKCTYSIHGCKNINILQQGSQTQEIDSSLHNFNNYYHSGNTNPITDKPWQDGDIPGKQFGIQYSQALVEEELEINGRKVPARLINVNTDDGSCYRIGCMDELAVGEFASGYDPLATVSPEEYGLDSMCVYYALPRAPILRIVCTESYDGINVCNHSTTETVQVIVDNRDNSINSYPQGGDFRIESIPMTDSRLSASKLNFPQDGYSPNIFGNIPGVTSFPNVTEELTIARALENSGQLLSSSLGLVFELPPGEASIYPRYNCVENPILSNGTGGCYLFSYENETFSAPLEGCSISPVVSVSEGNCNNVSLFSGGYVVDSSWLSQEFQTIDNNCSFYSPKYIVGGSLASTGFENNGEIVSSPPPLSEHQTAPEVGYPCLDPANNSPCQEGSRDVSRIKAVGNVLSDVFLYTEKGDPYVGGIVIEDVDAGNKPRQISAYNIQTSSKGSLLYTRNELLRQGVELNEYEKLAKKIREVKEKIINLTIFTDN